MTEIPLPNFGEIKPSAVFSLNKFIILALILLGTGSGLLLGKQRPAQMVTKPTTSAISNTPLKTVSLDNITDASQLEIGKDYGSNSTQFKDKATGTLEKGGINNVGTHTLIRPGGVTQKAALTSSVLDLDLFVGREVEVTGETNASTKVGWLLDVGAIKILK